MLEVLQNVEGEVLLWIQNGLRCGLLDGWFAFYTKLGDAGLLWIILSAAMMLKYSFGEKT